jgi:preprotein translocase subunit SecA
LSGFGPLPLPSVLRTGVDVRQIGGLRIVGTERHESRRIDNQLRGRSGRQGDPGSTRFYLSLDDDLMKRFAGPTMANLMRRMGLKDGIPIESPMVSRQVEKAQKKVEEYHYGIRKNLLEYDQVANSQRTIIYRQRVQVLEGKDLEKMLLGLYRKALDEVVQKTAEDGTRGKELAQRISDTVAKEFGLPAPATEAIPVKDGGDACLVMLMSLITTALEARKAEMGEVYDHVMRFVLLDVIDRRWKDHLYAMDHLRHAIGLEGYAQKDPRMRYKEEGYRLFNTMTELINHEVARLFFRLQVQAQPPETEGAGPAPHLEAAGFKAAAAGEAPPRPLAPPRPVAPDLLGPGPTKRPGPTEPCPCGSGAQFRNCHGK